MLALALYPIAPRYVETPVHAQFVQGGSIGSGFVLNAEDLRFIYRQILVAQEHVVTRATTGNPCPLIGPGPNQVSDPQIPKGLRTVDGTCNNLVPSPAQPNPRNEPNQYLFGSSDRTFPRLTTPVYRDAETNPATGLGTSYKQKINTPTQPNLVYDSQPRVISNLIVDQTAANPAAVAAALHPCGSGGFVCSDPPDLASVTDADSGALFIPNITPDFGLSAPFNLMFAFFGQFFDHGLDLVTKGGGMVIMPLQADDPLIAGPDHILGTADDLPPDLRFMPMTRGQNQPGPDGILGTADDIQEGINETTPWVDQNQTYTSHPSHQVFLREYALVGGKPAQTGLVLDGGFCAPRPTGIPGDQICDIGSWQQVKAQAAQMLGIQLVDQDVFNVPLILTDPYGHFKPGPNGFPQLVRPGNVLVEGDPTANSGLGVDIPADALRTGHAFLNDIAHNAAPSPGLTPDLDTTICDFRAVPSCQPAGTYDDELLNAHFITGDGRGNENIGLTMVHNIFHAEHNRLRYYIDQRIGQLLPQAEIDAWHAVDPGSGWNYEERLFQAARLVTEMEYQHLVFEEFARTVQPLINPFLGGLTNIDAAISAEFAHTVYRLGHSMLPERLDRINDDGSDNEIRLLDAFLNPLAYNNGGPAGTLNAAQAAGSLIRGLSRQIGNELDEFVTESVRSTLVGLPLDLPAINMARGRSEGIPPLNVARAQFFNLTQDPAVQPYANWSEFRFGLKHDESFANFLAAYATDPRITSKTTVADKRAAAIVMAQNPVDDFFFQPAATSGLDNVDFWVGGLAEKQAVFGGLLGSTFNYVFELQLEHLQDGDRFYYLQRLDGTNLVQQLEGNSLAELARRNTTIEATMDVIFNTADFILNASDPMFGSATPVDMGGGISVFTQADGTKVFFDPLHAGKNIIVNGTAGNDRWKGDVGDDTMLGNDGNDRLDGYEGNDTLIGGDGDDILLGGNGDDVLKGGPGNDALNSGPGFGADLEIANEGNDFLVGGNDGVEYFAGPGDDIIVDGTMRAEQIVGGAGDDWLDDGEGHDGGMFGDEANNFDLLAGLNVTGGDDVEGGGPGQDNHFGFGGDDIYLMSEGSNKFFGDYGFDWITLRGWNAPEFIELSLLANAVLPVNFNDLRNRYRFVDGASGWNLNDHIAGSNKVLCTPPGEVAECLVVGMELTAGTAPLHEAVAGQPGAFNLRGGSGAAKIAGLTGLMAEFGAPADLNAPAIPDVKGVGFMGGDILLGGLGSDTLEGKKGDDLIDGDAWLNVQLRAVYNNGTVRFVDGPRDLVADIFASPNQLLNPGNISIVRSIVDATVTGATPQVVPPADCGAATPLNCDTAVFAFPRVDYLITRNANNTVTVQHVPARAADIPASDGTDTLRNIERLLFSDGVVVDLAAPLNSLATGTVTISSTTPTEGVLLAVTASITDGNGFDPAAIVFDWQAETAPGVFTVVSTGPTFTPGNPQVGQALRVTARFTDNAGFSEAVRSDPTAPVINVNNPPVGVATLSQTLPQEGEAILASPAGITDADGLVGVAFSFQWQQAATAAGPFANIAGATSVSFTPAQAQVNQVLRVNVTFTDNHGTAEAVTSAATDVVGDLFVGTAGPDTFDGTAGRDNATGLAGADILNGNAGDDVLIGNGGNDTLRGGAGNDTLTGANGDDTIVGGPGDDLIRVGVNDGIDDVNGGVGVDTIQVITGANGTVIGLSALAGVEFISANGAANVSIAMTGGGGADTFDLSPAIVTLTGITAISMDGGDGNDTLTGSGQVDTINGGAGADTISGGGGADIINGGGGADTINGGAGPDDINGGAGNDTMTGGAGANIFRLTANFGNDTITDFKANGIGQDLVNVNALGITTAAQFNARSTMATVGANTLVTIFTDATRTVAIGTITFVGVPNAQLNAADFQFTP